MEHAPGTKPEPTRGHRKRERTRRQLLEAGLRVLAVRGEALTVSDVVSEADVSNGTFYNYFVDREDLVDALAEHALLELAAGAAREPIDDPAERLARASARVLQRAAGDRPWARAVLRLVHRPTMHRGIDRYLREDLADGLARGRFRSGADDATADQITGLLLMTIRRIVEGEPVRAVSLRALQRALASLGIEADSAAALAASAWDASAPTAPERGDVSGD